MNCHFHVAEVSPSHISFHLIEAHTVAQAEIPGYDMMICECEYKRQHKTQDMYYVCLRLCSGEWPASSWLGLDS